MACEARGRRPRPRTARSWRALPAKATPLDITSGVLLGSLGVLAIAYFVSSAVETRNKAELAKPYKVVIDQSAVEAAQNAGFDLDQVVTRTANKVLALLPHQEQITINVRLAPPATVPEIGVGAAPGPGSDEVLRLPRREVEDRLRPKPRYVGPRQPRTICTSTAEPGKALDTERRSATRSSAKDCPTTSSPSVPEDAPTTVGSPEHDGSTRSRNPAPCQARPHHPRLLRLRGTVPGRRRYWRAPALVGLHVRLSVRGCPTSRQADPRPRQSRRTQNSSTSPTRRPTSFFPDLPGSVRFPPLPPDTVGARLRIQAPASAWCCLWLPRLLATPAVMATSACL